MAFCTECGTNNPGNNVFCTECGKPLPNTGSGDSAVVIPAAQTEAYGGAPPVPGSANTITPPLPPTPPAPAPGSANTYTPPPPVPFPAVNNIQSPPPNAGFAGSKTPQPVNTSVHGVISVGGYVGTLILFSIPIIGWIACIIMAIVAKNPNRRNFARAMLIITIIMIAISVVLYFILGWIWEVILEYAQGYVEDATGGFFSDIGGFGNLFGAAD